MIGIDGNIGCEVALHNIVGVHSGIPKVKGQAKLYENMIDEPIPPTDVELDVILIPIIPLA